MSMIPIRINGREYQVACEDGQEDQLRGLAEELDHRVRGLVRAMGSSPGEILALVLTGLTMADEIIEKKKEIDSIASEVRRLALLVNDDRKHEQDDRMVEIENAMAITLEEIAMRIEKIADQVELS